MTTEREPAKEFSFDNLNMGFGSAEGIGDGSAVPEQEKREETRIIPEDPIITASTPKFRFRDIVSLSIKESKEGAIWAVDEAKLACRGMKQRVAHWLGPVAANEASIRSVDKVLHEGPLYTQHEQPETDIIEQPADPQK